MEHLMNPDSGMMIWTIVVFFLLVYILARFAWGPLIQALNDREAGIRQAIADAQGAKVAAEAMKVQYEKDLAEAHARSRAILSQTEADAQRLREQILADAQREAQRLADAHRKQLEEEKAKAIRDLRAEVASLSVRIAEKVIRQRMDPKVQEDLINSLLNERS